MASGLGEYWLIRGLLQEGTEWLHEILERAPDACGARATALAWLAVFTSVRSGFTRGGQLFEESIALYGQAGERDGQARALAILGFWRANQENRQGAAETIDQAVALVSMARDRYFAAFAPLMASMTASLMRDRAMIGFGTGTRIRRPMTYDE